MADKPRSPGRRSREQAARTRSRILNRAERLFGRRGYRGLTTRQLAKSCDVSPFTIQHHFGSKLGLYRAVLGRWDEEVRERLTEALAEERDLTAAAETVVEELFDYLLKRRTWLRVGARAALGEPTPKSSGAVSDGWADFMASILDERGLGEIKLDLRLLLITVEGLLKHHVLADGRYQQLFGKGLNDPQLRERTREHLKTVLVALLQANR